MQRVILLLAAACLVQTCLITNCPRGGKRSPQPDCRRCGPGLEGRCLGKAVCCGPRIGCLIGSPPVLAQCASEPNRLPAVRGALRCSTGLCLADGVCCSPDGCKMDMSCEVQQSADACSPSEQQLF